MNRKTFCSKNNYRNRPDIVDKEAQILACPVSVVEFENIPKTEGKKYVDYKNKSFNEKLNQSFKEYIRNRFGFFAFILQILYDIFLHRQYP